LRIAIAFCMFVLLSSLTPLSAETTNAQSSTQPTMRTQSDIPETPVGSGFFFQPRIWTGAMNLKHTDERIITLREGSLVGKPQKSQTSIETTIPIIGVGATLVYKRFFLDAYLQKASDGEDKKTETIPLTQTLTSKTDTNYSTIEREDYSFSLGYRATDRLSVFAGYRAMGQTSYEELGSSTLSDGRVFQAKPNSHEFKADGPFVGLAYTYPFSERGQINLNIGYAQLNGEMIDTIDGEVEPANASTSGLTYGVGWRGSIYKNLSYGLSVDKYDYEFDLDGYGEFDGKIITDRKMQIKDEILTFKFTLSYTF